METVQIDFRKWNDQPHWRFTMNRLGVDEHGLWLWSPPGAAMQRGHEPVREAPALNVKLIPDGKWWTAIWSYQREIDLYVDIITPPSWHGDTVTMVDMDLDVVRMADGRVEVVDEDEFQAHQAAMDYPPRLVDTVRATAARIAIAVENRHEPFGEVGISWMSRAAALAGLDHG